MMRCVKSRQMMRRAASLRVLQPAAPPPKWPSLLQSRAAPAAGRARAVYAKVRARETRLRAPEAAEIAVVKLEQIGKRYAGGAPVISDVSLTLEAGGFYLLTGASGSGKTTLLRLITLAEQPTQGRLTLFGADTAALDRNARAALRSPKFATMSPSSWLGSGWRGGPMRGPRCCPAASATGSPSRAPSSTGPS